MLADRLHQHEEHDHRQDGDPGALQELGDQDDHQDSPGHGQPDRVDDPGALHATPLDRITLRGEVTGPVPDHAELAQRERHEDADDVELDQPGHLGVEGQDQHDRDHGQEDDAVAVGKPVAPGTEGPRSQAVASQDGAEHWEAVERGVGCEHQHDAGHGHHEVEARREVVEHGAGDLRDHRVLVVVGGQRLAVGGPQPVEVVRVDVLQAHLAGQHDDTGHHRDRDHAQQQQGGRRVLRLRPTERGHPVGDRLDTGQGRASRRERAGQQEHQRHVREGPLVPGGLGDLEVGALHLGRSPTK